MSYARDAVLLEWGGLADDTTLSGQLCPSCHGGVGGERSLSVGKKGGLLWWRCHRNKCGERGMHGAFLRGDEQPVVHDRGRWKYEREPLSVEWVEWLSNRFRILNEIVEILGFSILHPVVGPQGSCPAGRSLRMGDGEGQDH